MRPTVVAVVALLAVLAGCGGGGGTGGPGTPTATQAPTATDAPERTPTATPTATATATPDPRPGWVAANGSVDGADLAALHRGALPTTVRVTVDREGAPDLSLWTGPDAARLDVGVGPARGRYDAGPVAASRDADREPPQRYAYGLEGPATDAVYRSVRGAFPGAYLRAATLAYEGPAADGAHRVAVTGVAEAAQVPGPEGRLVDLSGTATVGPDGLVRSLSVVETVRTPDGDRVERAVEVRVTAVDEVPAPDWLAAVPQVRAARTADGRAVDLTGGGATLPAGATVRLENESGVVGRATLNASLSPGERRRLALVVENGSRRLVATNGTTPANATRLSGDLVVAVDTDAAAMRVAVGAADGAVGYSDSRPSNSFDCASARCSANVDTSMPSASATSVALASRGYSK